MADAVDRLAGPLEVVVLRDAQFGGERMRAPHRHDYHELIWTSAGSGRHRVDGEVVPVLAGTITLIGRGQVHVFEEGMDISGAVVRFTDAVVDGRRAWLLASRTARTVAVPPGDAARLDALVDTLAAEARRPPDAHGADIERQLLSVLLLWLERWVDATRTQQRDPAELELYRRFVDVLERDFARHGDARHYADALAVPPAALARALTEVTGRSTKELITDRRMTEAERLLRYTDLNVGEVAFTAGYSDPLYFSRAFKRRYDVAPGAFRDGARGA